MMEIQLKKLIPLLSSVCSVLLLLILTISVPGTPV